MKNSTKSIARLVLFMVLSGLFMTSCKKSDSSSTPTPAAATPTGTLWFHLHTNADTNEIDNYDSVYTITGGRKIIVTLAQCYISHIQLIGLNGTVSYSVPNKVIFKVQATEPYLVGQVPVGNYESVSYQIGLDSATNLTTPAGPSDTVFYQPTMWYSTTPQPNGYVYIVFEGKIDTTTKGNGTVAQMQPFTYRLGTKLSYRTIAMPSQNYTITAGQTQFIHMIIDYYHLFNGIKLNNSANLSLASPSLETSMNPLAVQLANNIVSGAIGQGLIRYEE